MNRFAWGEVLKKFEYDFDGSICRVTKYHPWERTGIFIYPGMSNKETINFHCDDLSSSFESIEVLLIAWIAYKRNGIDQRDLVLGICRDLCLLPEVTHENN